MKFNYTFISMLILLLIGSLGFAADANVSELVVSPDWSIAWQFVDNNIEFTLMAPTTGWVSIGFNPTKMMKDAEYVLGYVQDGKLVVRQDYGTGLFSHKPVVDLGRNQEITEISGTQDNSVTTLVFRLPLHWGKDSGIEFTKGQSFKVLLAYGKDGSRNFTAKHSKKKVVTVTL
ncbi:DOMON domain-containing protein [uncultured Sphaerochaeta sp.]|uniref:DOMON domain-containing protein n=1 Tax=uncultured Sphaerochaeta sp. TaxID=886478 RepID=UPI002A0A730C|nr:DOMON domain-containing protein [uncultured Sphaerochaeta sp.]